MTIQRLMFGMKCSLAGLVGLFCASVAQAQFNDGHGPDAWQVTGVASNDVLNIRMGPGTIYPVIDAFAYNENGLQQITCVPLVSFEQSVAMTEADRANLPSRWCLMTDAQQQKVGWVAGRFLMEGQLSGASMTAPETGNDRVAIAVRLVERLYRQHDQYIRGAAPSPYEMPSSDQFFFQADLAKIAATVRSAGADPLYNAQDTDIRGLDIVPDTSGMRQGLITLWAEFSNFGSPQRVAFDLRSDTQREGAPIRIMRISHDGWNLP